MRKWLAGFSIVMSLLVGGAPLVGGSAWAQSYPAQGRSVTILVPFSAGGPSDVIARVLAAQFEKDLGGTFLVVNKPGATTQIANTELYRSRPDGYMLAVIPPPSISVTYLDPERKAPYGRKDFQAIVHFASDANLLIVANGSPLRTLKDAIDAARGRPGRLRIGTSGLMGNTHLGGIDLEDAAGVSFAFVHFNGAADQATALLGGNVDVVISSVGPTLPHVRAGTMRVLASMAPDESPFLPGVKTLRGLGYDVISPTSFGLFGPAGIPDSVQATLVSTVKKAMENPKFRKRVEDLALVPHFMDSAAFTAYWLDVEARMKRMLESAKKRQN